MPIEQDSSSKQIPASGIIFAAFVLVGNALQPIINNARPPELDGLIFTFMAVFFECISIAPVYILEQKITGCNIAYPASSKATWREHWIKFILIGSIFAFATYFVIIGYSSFDSTSGGVIVKTQPISMLFIGYFFLNEKITKQQILFTFVMLAAVFHIATKGTWQIAEITPGIIFLIIAPVMWNIGHTLAKKVLADGTITTPQLIFIRTGVSSIILAILYFSITGGTTIWQIFDMRYFPFMLFMGVNYTMLHYFWYKSITKIDLAFGTALIIPSPAITAIFGTIFLGEIFQFYHAIGIAGTIIGLYGLLYAKYARKDRKIHPNVK